ncbi:MAG: class I SAM-dependent methyltransferase [archaeon]
MAEKLGYEKDYHSFFHKHLLNDERYYMFRAKYADEFYWPYFYLDGGVMEFGVGLGQNISMNKDRAFGVDISDFCARNCAERGIRVIKDINKVKSSSLSGVLCCHCLEHLENPALYLKEFFRVLERGGRLVLLLPVEPNNVSKFRPSPTQHLFAWNFQTIGDLLTGVGFRVKVGKFNYATGFLRFYNLPFSVAVYFIKTLGMLTDTKELLVVAEKP